MSADALEAALAAEDVAARALQAEGDVAEAAAALAAATGVSPLPPPPRTATPPPSRSRRDAWPAWIALAHRLPAALAHAWTATAARLLAAEAEGAGGSWLTVGAQAQRNSSDQWQLYALVGARWSAFDRNQRARSHALEAAHLAAGDAATAAERARVVMALAFHDVAHAREVEHHHHDATLPAADRLVAAREVSPSAAPPGPSSTSSAPAPRASAPPPSSPPPKGIAAAPSLDAWLLVPPSNAPEPRDEAPRPRARPRIRLRRPHGTHRPAPRPARSHARPLGPRGCRHRASPCGRRPRWPDSTGSAGRRSPRRCGSA